MSEERVSRRSVLKGAGIAGVAGLAAAVPMAALAPGVASASADGGRADALVGAWRGTASPSVGPSFGLLASFATGGTLVTSGSVDLQPNNLSTPAYGAWARTEDGNYNVNFVFFTFDTTGNPAGRGEVKAHVAVDGDHFRGSFTLTIFDSSGTVVFTAGGKLEATRIKAD